MPYKVHLNEVTSQVFINECFRQKTYKEELDDFDRLIKVCESEQHISRDAVIEFCTKTEQLIKLAQQHVEIWIQLRTDFEQLNPNAVNETKALSSYRLAENWPKSMDRVLEQFTDDFSEEQDHAILITAKELYQEYEQRGKTIATVISVLMVEMREKWTQSVLSSRQRLQDMLIELHEATKRHDLNAADKFMEFCASVLTNFRNDTRDNTVFARFPEEAFLRGVPTSLHDAKDKMKRYVGDYARAASMVNFHSNKAALHLVSSHFKYTTSTNDASGLADSILAADACLEALFQYMKILIDAVKFLSVPSSVFASEEEMKTRLSVYMDKWNSAVV